MKDNRHGRYYHEKSITSVFNHVDFVNVIKYIRLVDILVKCIVYETLAWIYCERLAYHILIRLLSPQC